VTDRAWVAGYLELTLAFPSKSGERKAEAEARGRLYRKHLGHLSDGAWLHSVSEAIRTEGFFPTVAVLLDLASTWRDGPTLAKDEKPQLPSAARKELSE
jgi:hypothetical protein